MGGSNDSYETSRMGVRDYIKEYLLANEFKEEQIIWNKFQWDEKKAVQREVVTTTWMGVNILIWTNTTAHPTQKVRIFGAHYDTMYWGKQK